jgi:hypothetical protein
MAGVSASILLSKPISEHLIDTLQGKALSSTPYTVACCGFSGRRDCTYRGPLASMRRSLAAYFEQ